MLRIFVQCHKCGRHREIGQESKAGWYDPYYVLQADGYWLQTCLCPKCAPWWSLGFYLQWHRHPRWLHRLYALARGYFWLPCPSCGRYFGGHEQGGGTLGNQCTCPMCNKEFQDA